MVPEVIRWQTPLSYMRRTATKDTELGGKRDQEDDQLLMWYVSATATRTSSRTPDVLDIERQNADRQLSFGYGIHFCMGSRVAETAAAHRSGKRCMKRFEMVEVVRTSPSVSSRRSCR